MQNTNLYQSVAHSMTDEYLTRNYVHKDKLKELIDDCKDTHEMDERSWYVLTREDIVNRLNKLVGE